MLTRPEAADPAVEELKRRARRRLVGAIVLALAAAVTYALAYTFELGLSLVFYFGAPPR